MSGGARIETPSGVVIEYDDEKHKYLVNGERFPSVTTILGVVDKSGPLMAWAVKETKEGRDYRATRDTAATRGTSIHDALEALATHGTPPSLSAVPEEDRGYVQALAAWWVKHDPEPLMVEQIVASVDMRYAGRFDLLAEIDGRVHLIDLKSSRRIYNVAHAQVVAYALALDECGWEPPDVCSILRVGEDGEFEFIESMATPRDFETIAEAYEVVKRLNRKPKAAKPMTLAENNRRSVKVRSANRARRLAAEKAAKVTA